MVYTKVAIILFRTKFLRVFLISHGQNFKVTKSNAQCNMGIIFNTRDVCVGLVCTHNNVGIIFNTRVRRGWSLAVGWYVLTMMRVLFLIPVMCRTCLAEVGEHQ